MLLEIDDQKTVGDLKERFSECFPLLKLEFFSHVHHFQKGQPLKDDLELSAIRKVHEPGVIEIKSGTSLEKLTHQLKELFGLHVKILRRHGPDWIGIGELHQSIQEASELASVSLASSKDQLQSELEVEEL